MKRTFTVVLLLFVHVHVLNAQSQDPKLDSAIEALRLAMISGDRQQLESIASDRLSYGHSGGKVENKQEFVEGIASGRSDFVTIDFTEQTIVISGKTAIVRQTLSAQTNDNGKPGTVKLKVMLVMQKEKKQWLMLARQAVKVP